MFDLVHDSSRVLCTGTSSSGLLSTGHRDLGFASINYGPCRICDKHVAFKKNLGTSFRWSFEVIIGVDKVTCSFDCMHVLTEYATQYVQRSFTDPLGICA